MNDDFEHDGLSEFNLAQIGMQTSAWGTARLLKFNDGQFVTREGEVISPDRELMAIGLKKVLQKFVGKRLVETEVVPDGQAVPDLKMRNEACPREEWGTDLAGNPAGPWSLTLALKLLDPATMSRFVFITGSKGGSIAIGALSEDTRLIRRLRNDESWYPIVKCSSTSFPIKRLNIVKKRPDFRVKRFEKFGSNDGGGGLGSPKPPKPLAPPSVDAPPESSSASEVPTERPRGATAMLDAFAGQTSDAPTSKPSKNKNKNKSGQDELPL